MKAFRIEYAHLGELRSLAGTVPMVALTATATAATRLAITKSLGLRNEALIIEPPKRDNIKFVVITTKEKDIFQSFKWVMDGLQEDGKVYKKTIIFCRTKKQCNTLYARFEHALSPQSVDSRHFAKFHAQTDEEVKAEIATDFKDDASRIRVLFATVAFGMGIDVQGVHTIIQYGPPHDMEEYIQESGRAGRDGKDSVAILVSYPGAANLSRPDTSIKEFINSTSCRRVLAMAKFEGKENQSSIIPHMCCDICAVGCKCGVPTCSLRSRAEMYLSAIRKPPAMQQRRIVTDEQQTVLQERLVSYRDGRLAMDHSLAGSDITSGFPLCTMKLVVKESNLVFDVEQFVLQYVFYDNMVAREAFSLVEDVLQHCEMLPAPQSTSRSSSSSESSEDEEEVIHRPVYTSSESD